ncbi:cytochrome o ubiquinol oxidase subunit IV [Jiella sp. MQZ13P-4]|uniref:Cytochrome bo(3) ubiquinol oxidase subunit 4 n=1 Tax=Jiella sonneratiae TaxID=2816856 RepID=A0ABS3JB98_9HYPH|nr:cytochrome o ubiquinol oxidase subunit IV [Jiella sonneratiae]
MSSASQAHHGSHGHGHGHEDHGHHEGGESHSTLSGYLTGFGLSVVLTVIPFWLVMARPIEDGVVTTILVILLAVAQIVVHMIYFLHMDAKSEGGWTIMALIFTVVLLVITISGSLWVMYHLNSNMMPMESGMDMDGGAMQHGQGALDPAGDAKQDNAGDAAMPGMDMGHQMGHQNGRGDAQTGAATGQ